MTTGASSHGGPDPAGRDNRYGSLVLADRVHSDIYTDETIFRDELDRIFHAGWVYVGHESEIPAPGDFRRRAIGRQPVILVRGEDSEIRVLMNRCTHRGALVCALERGNERFFTCAYHGWSFRTSGKLTGIPHGERYGPEFRKQDYDLRPAAGMGRYRGFIFATVSADAPSFDDYLHSRARRAIDNVLDRSPEGTISATAGIHKYGYNGNWKLQLENSVDAYHLNYLHRSFFKIQTARTGVRNTDIGAGDSLARVRSLGGGHVAWDFSPMKRAGENALADPRRSAWQQKYVDDLVARNGRDRTLELMDAGQGHVLIFPNLVILATQIRTITPVAVDRTEVFIYPFTFDGAPEEMNRARLKGHEAFYGPAGSGATDDLEVFERQTVGFRAGVDPWILISRGLAQERRDNDGAISSQITDELSNRAILHHWRTLMSARGNEGGGAVA